MSGEGKQRVQQVVVGAVIINTSNKVLVVHRPLNEETLPDFFELPSGKKEIGEDVFEALKREVKEETGLNFTEAHPFDVFDYEVEKPNLIKETTQINFLITLETDDPKITLSEHDEFRWIERSELGILKISDKTRETIESAFRNFSNST